MKNEDKLYTIFYITIMFIINYFNYWLDKTDYNNKNMVVII